MTDTMRGSGALSPRYEAALALAANIHHDQRRKGTDVAYLSHVMSVSSLVLEDGGSEDEAIAALLHDAVEDGNAGDKERVARFGPEVLAIVEACSDDEPEGGDKKPWRFRKARYVKHLLDPSASVGAVRVTGADKLHNARCIVDDLRIDGALPKFNACKHQTLWYYATVSSAVTARLPERSRIAINLDVVVDEMCAALGEPRPASSPEVPVCDCENAAA